MSRNSSSHSISRRKFLAATGGVFAVAPTLAQTIPPAQADTPRGPLPTVPLTGSTPMTVKLKSGQFLEARALAPGVFRVRLGPSAVFAQSLQERYGVVRSGWPGVPVGTRSTAGTVMLSTAEGDLTVDKASGKIALRDHAGHSLSPEIAPLLSNLAVQQRRELWLRAKTLVEMFRGEDKYPVPNLGDSPENMKSGFGLTCSLQPDERFYGLGTASKQHIQLRGQAFYNWVRYRHDEQPVPFVMSSAGWGLFLNTSWRHYIDIGKGELNRLFIWGPEGDLDFFLITGSGFPELLNRYTQITGRPMLLPQWAYGLTWINHVLSNQYEVLENARTFRQEHIPCDGFGLDAGWEKKGERCSTKLEWNTDRFYIPKFMKGKGGRNQSFIAALRRLGFKLHLWVCTDYDLTGEEERVIAEREHRPVPPGPEAWFAHLKGFLDDGVAGWKFDPAHLVDLPKPNRRYANGRSESEMHNLNQVLMVKQVNQGQTQYTGRRAMMQYCGGWAGTQRWAASTVGDIMAGPDGVAWMLNSGMSGFMNTSGDMWVNRPASLAWCYCSEGDRNVYWPEGAGIHLGFLSAWTLIDGWAYSEQPWLAGEKLEHMVKAYARLRYSLMPYIYSAAHTGSLSGMPIMRAMPLMFPDDPALQDSIRQYMLGDDLLVTVFTPKVRFPVGRWIDYWTGKEYFGPAEITYQIPEGRGGGLFIRAGAILPCWREMDYVAQKPVDELSLHVYPEGRSHFTLYEDDGLTPGYDKGEVAQTDITCQRKQDEVTLTIAPRRGTYVGMPDRRSFQVWIHGTKPVRILVNRQPMREGLQGWQFDGGAKAIRLQLEEDPRRKAPQVVHVLWQTSDH
jgi:alpha-glucosidase (family GH31 glycosyl hydrolase)